MNLFLADSSSSGMPWYDEVVNWVSANPWIIFVAAGVISIIIMIFELAVGRPRAVERIRSRYDSDDEVFMLKEIRNRDIRFLVLNGVFFVLPAIAFAVMYFFFNDLLLKQYNGWIGNGFLIYYGITSIVMAIVRKDFLLLILWKIPTLTLFIKTHNTVDKGYYDVTVYSDGSAKVEEHFSWATIILGILGFMLFTLKMFIMALYLAILAIGNIFLSAVIFPIMYGIFIGKDTKEIKLAEQGDTNYSYSHPQQIKYENTSYDDDSPYTLD